MPGMFTVPERIRHLIEPQEKRHKTNESTIINRACGSLISHLIGFVANTMNIAEIILVLTIIQTPSNTNGFH